ncbi:hypothetical protein [Arthrobacter sp. JSM 101049]|uniref:hypothetical protein n=1 Tax=Arthrobacter sp. JSM 101049 TaxID=929097 RepID=UPI003562714B
MDGRQVEGIVKRGFSGALAGVAGTAAMSAALGISDLFGVMDRQPPRIIIEDLLPGLSEDATTSVALVSHLGYGVGAGAAYGVLVAPEHRNGWTGALYGIAVWAVGYEG